MLNLRETVINDALPVIAAVHRHPRRRNAHRQLARSRRSDELPRHLQIDG